MQNDNLFFLKKYIWSNTDFIWTFKANDYSPIVVTIPHDRGFHPSDFTGLFELRKKGVKGHDKHVWPIVMDIINNVNVNVVRGLFPRHFIDYNRSPGGISYGKFSQTESETAFDDERLLQSYNSYHDRIVKFLMEAIQRYGSEKVLLVDLHGFIKQPTYGEYDLIFGTGNRSTVRSDIDKIFAHFMTARGYKIFLPTESIMIIGQNDKYDADFTTHYYAEKFGIDAIQIEIAKKFRVLEGTETGQKLSADMADFLKLYFSRLPTASIIEPFPFIRFSRCTSP